MNQFKVGDVVRLKSGGPDMTVCIPGLSTSPNVWVVYVDGGGLVRKDTVPPEALIPAVLEVEFAPGRERSLYEALGIPRPVGPDVFVGSDPSPPGKTHHDLGGEG